MPVPVGAGGSTATTAPSAASLSVGQIIDRVTRQFGDEANIQITTVDVIRWINDAQRELAIHNQLLQSRATASGVRGQAEYTLPNDILTVRSIRYNGKKLVGMAAQEAEEYIEDSTTTGEPQRFWIWAGRLTLYPAPEANGADDLSIFYTRNPAVVQVATDFPELPAQYHNRIVEYCLKQAYELDENWQAAQVKGQEWEAGIRELKDNTDWVERDFYPSIVSLPGDY